MRLKVETFLGRRKFYSIVSDTKLEAERIDAKQVAWDEKLGTFVSAPRFKFYHLTPEQVALGLDWCTTAHKAGFFDLNTPEQKKKFSDNVLAAVVGIIKTSNQEGEVANAKAVYKKITDQEWRG